MRLLGKALTFDDVLLVPAYSQVAARHPARHQADAQHHAEPAAGFRRDGHRDRSAAGDRDRPGGGIGIVHKNLTPRQQAAEVARVKRYECSVLRDAITIAPGLPVREVIALSRQHGISGFPVIEDGRVVGIVTGRDLRFETRMDAPVREIMTPRERLITVGEGDLARLQAAGFYAVCSVPWDEVRELFDQERKRLTFKKASYLSIEQKRRRKRKKKREKDLPLEHYELAVTNYTWKAEESKQLIPSRVIFVFSTADQKVVRAQRQKQVEKLQAGLAKLQDSVAQGHRSTDPQSVSRRVNKLFGTKQAGQYFTWEMTALTPPEQSQLPRPKPGCTKPTHRFTFRFDEAAVKHDEPYDGYFPFGARRNRSDDGREGHGGRDGHRDFI